MPRKRRTVTKRADQEIRRLLSNPFSALDEFWLDPGFDWPTAKRIWRAIREDVLADWKKRYPGKRPIGAILFDKERTEHAP
jgi:hypothetical protein